MNFRDKDKNFQNKVKIALWERHKINVNRDVGTAYLQPEFEDRINPKVKITPEDIKSATGREKLRGIILDEYVEEFNKQYGLTATKEADDSITLSIVPIRRPDNEFKSLAELTKKNKEDVENDPELGEDIDW